jgi:hypothetical protein
MTKTHLDNTSPVEKALTILILNSLYIRLPESSEKLILANLESPANLGSPTVFASRQKCACAHTRFKGLLTLPKGLLAFVTFTPAAAALSVDASRVTNRRGHIAVRRRRGPAQAGAAIA